MRLSQLKKMQSFLNQSTLSSAIGGSYEPYRSLYNADVLRRVQETDRATSLHSDIPNDTYVLRMLADTDTTVKAVRRWGACVMTHIDYRTEVEASCHYLIETMLDMFTSGRPVIKADYVEMLGHLRDMKVTLDNKMFGCKTGKHSGACKCAYGRHKEDTK